MPRRKPRSLSSSVVFRAAAIVRKTGLEPLLLRCMLKMAWLGWRIAYEISSIRLGAEFETATRGITDDLLRRTVPPNGTVLDLGCGAGRLSRMAAPYSGTVYGVDTLASNIERARSLGVPPNVQYVCADGREVLAQRVYDVVLLVHVLEHIDAPDELLRSLRERAKILIVEVPNFEADPLNSVRVALGSPFFADADHVREYTPQILRAQLERNGLRVTELFVTGASIVAVAAA